MTSQNAPSDQVQAYADALRSLRKRAGSDQRGISQEQAAASIGQRKQSWQLYEQGKIQSIMRLDVQDRLTRALGFTREDLEREKNAVLREAAPDRHLERPADPPPSLPPAQPGQGRPSTLSLPIWGRGRGGPRGAHVYDLAEPERWLDLATLYGPTCRAMQLIGDSMYPWASSGTTIVYDLDRWPRKDQGCVIETREHGYYVKLFDRSDEEKIYARELQPEPREIEFELEDVVGVYAVLDRIDR